MTFVFIAIAILVAITLLLVGRQGGLPEAAVDLRPEVDPDHPRFDVVLRGYRMDEVDATIARMQAELTALRAEHVRYE